MIKRLLYLNGLAILSVILYHSSAWGFTAMFFWTDRYQQVAVPNFDQLGSPTYFALRGIEQLIIFAIPSFLFVSGFFIAISTGRNQHTIGWKLVLNRVKDLLIPFLLWSILILALDILQGEQFGLLQIVQTIIFGQVADPYYFVPVLIQLYLLAPFLVPLAKNRWQLLLLFAGLLQLFVLFLRYLAVLNAVPIALEPIMFLTRNWFFPGFIFWFCFGIVTGFQLQSFKELFYRYRWFFVSGMVLFFILGMAEWEFLLGISGQDWIGPRETLVDHIYAGLFLLSYLSFDNFQLPLSKQISNLGTKSYGIYLAHSPALEYTARLIYHLIPGLLAYQILFQGVLYIMGLGIPLAMMEAVNRSPFRRYYKYIFG